VGLYFTIAAGPRQRSHFSGSSAAELIFYGIKIDTCFAFERVVLMLSDIEAGYIVLVLRMSVVIPPDTAAHGGTHCDTCLNWAV
jgi:hypothetical protein